MKAISLSVSLIQLFQLSEGIYLHNVVERAFSYGDLILVREVFKRDLIPVAFLASR